VYNLGLNDEIYIENSDELEIEDDALSSSNSVTHDLPKIEGMYNNFIIYIDTKFVN